MDPESAFRVGLEYGECRRDLAKLRAQLYACVLDRAAAHAEVARLKEIITKLGGCPFCEGSEHGATASE